MAEAIVDNRIAGTRITVFDVYHYLEGNWRPEAIAELFHLSQEQIQAAVDYIESHKEAVLAVHRQIEERIARGNPPEVLAKMEASRRKMEAWKEERRRAKSQEGNGEGDPRGC
jgi:uncharacterized protein (DUF433 family)